MFITKLIVGAVIVLGSGAVAAAPASADPNPFGSLTCGCQSTAPASGAALRDQIDRGIRNGLSGFSAAAR
jgi:hypothetical protein